MSESRPRQVDISKLYTDIGTGVDVTKPTSIIPIRIPDEHRKRGMIVVGTTGVGKTRLAEHLIEQDIAKGYNVCFIDPKGDQDIFSKIYSVALKHGREKELQLITPIYPDLSATLDPTSYYFSVDELVAHIASAVPPSKEAFFKGVAILLATVAIKSIYLEAAQQGEIPDLNFNLLREAIGYNSLNQTKTALREIDNDEARQIVGIIEDLLTNSHEHYSKVALSLTLALTQLSIGNIGRIVGQGGQNRFIERIERGEGLIAVVQTGALLFDDAANTLGRVIVSMLQKSIGRTYLSSKEKYHAPLALYIDESQKVLYPGIETIPAMAGSANVMTTFFVQDIAQLSSAIDEDFRNVILNTCNTKIFLRCPDAATSEYVSAHFGTKNVLTGIYAPNQVTTREVEQEAVRPFDVQSMLPRDFLMQTYSGRYKGKIATVEPSNVKVIFPDSPSSGSSYAYIPGAP